MAMTTPKKPPTLVALQRLADRKGIYLVVHDYGEQEHLTASEGVGHIPFLNGWSPDVPMREVAFAALSVLPDKSKPKARRRSERARLLLPLDTV